MTRAHLEKVEIEFDTFGDRSNPCLLLVMGLGVQMIAWPEQVCQELADRGFFVVRYDNRDCGLSTKFEDAGVPNLFAGLLGGSSTAAYTLKEMAADAVGPMDFLEIDRANIVGISMGGMIAQQAVIDHPSRFISLCSIMSTTGSRDVGQPSPEVINALLQPMAQDRESAIERSVEISRVISSQLYFDEARVRDLAARSYDRCNCPDGVARQLMAIVVSPDRTEALKEVKIPTLVIHGLLDKFVDPSGGIATADAIPGSKLVTLDEMAHDIPVQLWPAIRDAIIENADRGRSWM